MGVVIEYNIHIRTCTCMQAGVIASAVELISLLIQDDPEDLSFKKGDVMTVLRKDEDEWWFAQHEDGRRGSIPVPYVKVVSLAINIAYM